jgi:predicted glycosyltransferase
MSKSIWIDLDNTPHVPFFKPIIEELEKRGHPVRLTARDAFQVCDLARTMGLNCRSVGRHYGKSSILKIAGWISRAVQLLPIIWRDRPALAVSHGARSQLLLANFLGIPTVAFDDYEHSKVAPLSRPKWLIVPEAIPREALSGSADRILHYSGIKEDVYASDFKPDSNILEQIGLDQRRIIVTVRPPATEAHYHNPESEVLFSRFMDRATANPDLQLILLPRNGAQEIFMRKNSPSWFDTGQVIVPKALDGLNLLWHSDLVVSGGGTMNREAAALGVPVYSVFRGRLGAVDQQLVREGRLLVMKSVEDVDQIPLTRRSKGDTRELKSNVTLRQIVEHVEAILNESTSR